MQTEIPVCERAGIAKKFAYGDPHTHNKIVRLWGLTDIPRTLADVNKQVTLAVDVMFVNSVPFLVSVSRTINLITIEHAPKRTATKHGDLIQRIVWVYARAGCTVQTVLMDNKFEKLKDHVPMLALNLPAASEHVGEIERRI